MTNGVYILSGSNLGKRMVNLAKALELVEQNAGKVVAQSQLYETAAWGIQDQAPFLNQVMELETPLSARELLNALLEIEQKMGRQRKEKWGERLIDLDILYYGNSIIEEPGLNIPHPLIAQRRFTLVPLCELAPLLVHPVLRKDQLQLLEECPDKLEVKVWET